MRKFRNCSGPETGRGPLTGNPPPVELTLQETIELLQWCITENKNFHVQVEEEGSKPARLVMLMKSQTHHLLVNRTGMACNTTQTCHSWTIPIDMDLPDLGVTDGLTSVQLGVKVRYQPT